MELEQEREVIFLQNSLPPVSEESESSLVLRRAINICEDLEDDEAEVSDDHADLNETLASIKFRTQKHKRSKCAAKKGVILNRFRKH